MVAEHLVSDLLEHSNLQELNGSEKQFEVETERLNSRLEHARANNAVLALTLHESKAQCDRYFHPLLLRRLVKYTEFVHYVYSNFFFFFFLF